MNYCALRGHIVIQFAGNTTGINSLKTGKQMNHCIQIFSSVRNDTVAQQHWTIA